MCICIHRSVCLYGNTYEQYIHTRVFVSNDFARNAGEELHEAFRTIWDTRVFLNLKACKTAESLQNRHQLTLARSLSALLGDGGASGMDRFSRKRRASLQSDSGGSLQLGSGMASVDELRPCWKCKHRAFAEGSIR